MNKDKLFNFYAVTKQFYQYVLLFKNKLDNNTISVADIINLIEKFSQLEREYLKNQEILSVEIKFYFLQLKEFYKQLIKN